MKGIITANVLNVRSSPFVSGSIIGTLKKDSIIQIVGEKSGWFEIIYKNLSAFISANYVDIIEVEKKMKGKVTASVLNVRSRPDLECNILGTLNQEAIIDVINDLDDWLEISFNKASAFVSSRFVDLQLSEPETFGIVSVDWLNVRKEANTSSIILGQIPFGAKVTILGNIDNWYQVQFNDETGYLYKDYVDLNADQANDNETISDPKIDVDEIQLAPDILLPVSGTSTDKKVAATWNKYGGLLTSLSGSLKLDPACAVAVLCVESSGQGFTKSNKNRMTIRFENHLFWRYWGKQNPDKFHEHFKYGKTQNGKRKVWLGHAWREKKTNEWKTFHGNQAKEWEVLEFARGINEKAAIYSISMGAPQVMGFNHDVVGYDSAIDMFNEFSRNIVPQIKALFDFMDKRMIKALQQNDFETFAGYYNGSGQKQKYGAWIRNHYMAIQQLLT